MIRIRHLIRAWSAAPRLILVAVLIECSAVRAVIFSSTADPEHNTTPPTGALMGSGWELQGHWGYFLGTPISSQYFITAKHLGAVVGDKFSLNGVEYPTTAFFDDPNSDLRIWRVRGRFPSFCALYPRSDEVGKSLVVFGRGSQRGSEVIVAGLFGGALKGWQWGLADGRKRWGENHVGSVVNSAYSSGDQFGDLLRMPFTERAGPNEAHLSAGDSGGGVFIHDGTGWKLAGISNAVDGPYNTTDTGPGFYAAIFDEGGLYKGGEGNWTRVNDFPLATSGAFYATRISLRVDWINGVVAQSSSSEPPILESAPAVTGPYSADMSANLNQEAQVITLPQPLERRFYRLSAPTALRIAEIKVEAAKLVLRYE